MRSNRRGAVHIRNRREQMNINNAAMNAINSMYQMIIAVDNETMSCSVLDCNEEVAHIARDDKDFSKICERLYVNIHPEDRASFLDFTDPNWFPNELKNKVYTSIECRIRHSDDSYYWSRVIFSHATVEDNISGNDYLFLLEDVNEDKTRYIQTLSEERALLKELQAQYDALFEENMLDQQTGCYNRKGLKYYTDIVLDEAREKGKDLFVCVSDLNGLKYMNDTFGHAAGDEALAAISSILIKSAPQGTRIVRTGGDEFLLFAALSRDDADLQKMEEMIEEGIKKYNEEHDNPYVVGASYGWVFLPVKEGMIDLDEYIEMADKKMYEMKMVKDEHRRG